MGPSVPPLLSSLAPAPLVPPPPPPELKAAQAKVAEAAKLLMDAATMFPPYYGRVLPEIIALLTKINSQSEQPFGAPRLPSADGQPGPMLERTPAGGVGTGNPGMVLANLMSQPRG